jgi:hypothetical protein
MEAEAVHNRKTIGYSIHAKAQRKKGSQVFELPDDFTYNLAQQVLFTNHVSTCLCPLKHKTSESLNHHS